MLQPRAELPLGHGFRLPATGLVRLQHQLRPAYIGRQERLHHVQLPRLGPLLFGGAAGRGPALVDDAAGLERLPRLASLVGHVQGEGVVGSELFRPEGGGGGGGGGEVEAAGSGFVPAAYSSPAMPLIS